MRGHSIYTIELRLVTKSLDEYLAKSHKIHRIDKTGNKWVFMI